MPHESLVPRGGGGFLFSEKKIHFERERLSNTGEGTEARPGMFGVD